MNNFFLKKGRKAQTSFFGRQINPIITADKQFIFKFNMFSKQLIVVPSVIRQATVIVYPQRHNSDGTAHLNSASFSVIQRIMN